MNPNFSVCPDCEITHEPRRGLNCLTCGRWIPGFARLDAQRRCLGCVPNCEAMAKIVSPAKRLQPASERTRARV